MGAGTLLMEKIDKIASTNPNPIYNSGIIMRVLRGKVDQLLVLLLFFDLCLIAIHCIAGYWNWDEYYDPSWVRNLSIGKDQGIPEQYQYVKLFFCCYLIGAIAFRRRVIHYLSWMLLFLYLLADDGLQIHEKLGNYISRVLGFKSSFGLRSQDFGELVVITISGLLLLSLIWIAYNQGDRVFRQFSRHLLVGLMALGGCGVVLDMLHVVAPLQISNWVGLLEDGGEMVVVSAIVSHLWNVSHSTSHAHSTQKVRYGGGA